VAEPDTEILSPADGVVRFAGWVVDRPVLSIDHEGVLSTFEPVEALVHKGEKVTRGQVIGRLSTGAHCSCLHLGARQGENYLSPLAMLSIVPAAVLLPWD
jgi:murein DD-endopeptidase MepM/ murein hydrolase activator NlpD